MGTNHETYEENSIDPNAVRALQALHPNGYTLEQINAMIKDVFADTDDPLGLLSELYSEELNKPKPMGRKLHIWELFR